MDLTEVNTGRKSFSWSKVGILICFTLSAALLLNSLLNPNTLTRGFNKFPVQSNAAFADQFDR